MGKKATRDQIVEAADDLFYRQGYEHTSFTEIADAVGISRGNFYHHFKTKDDLLSAVIMLRTDRTHGLLQQWEDQGMQPADRIRSFIRILVANQTQIMRHGCPVGTLSTELSKLGHGAAAEANGLFLLFHAWLQRQFAQVRPSHDADALALHLLARSQGVATLAQAFQDADFVMREVALMEQWLDACLPAASQDKATPRRQRKAAGKH